MLEVQKFLRDNSLDVLCDKYKIVATRHRQYNNLVLLKYSMIDSPMGERIVQECRGIILNENDNWSIVSYPFNKFFNLGEGHAATIDWNTARVQEKVDGSLMTLYVWDDTWHVASSGTPDAGGPVDILDITFRDLFWNTYYNYMKELPSPRCRKCFFFELTGPANKIVVRHAETGLTLLGGRDLNTNQELNTVEALAFFPDIPIVKEYDLTSFDACIATFEHMSPVAQEGYVVVDGNFNRVKVKHPGYVALHHMKDGLQSKRALVEVVRSGEIDEVVTSFPEFETILLEAKGRLDVVVSTLEEAYEKHKNIVVQKDFALAIKDIPCYHALFALRAKKVPSVRAYLRDINIDTVMRLLKYRTDE